MKRKTVLSVCLLFLFGGLSAQEHVNVRTVYGKGVVADGTAPVNSTERTSGKNNANSTDLLTPVIIPSTVTEKETQKKPVRVPGQPAKKQEEIPAVLIINAQPKVK